MRERLVLIAVCVLMAAGCILSGCGRRSGQGGGGATGPEYRAENKKKIQNAVKIKEKYEDRIIDALEEIEPGYRIVSAEETGELGGGYLIDVKTESGNEYLINTFTDGSGANIKNKETGEILYSSDAVSEERDHMRNTWDINTALLMSKGMPEDNAEDIADAVKRAAPDEVIGRIEGYDPDTEDIEIKVTMETGKVFYITAKEEDDWKVRLSYEDEL